MANHKSAIKKIRQIKSRRLRNRYYAKTSRNLIKKLRLTTDKKEAEELLPKVVSLIDKMARKNRIHKNKAGNLKSGLTRHVNHLK
jgi:small subunit ribosomal protein S20